MTRNLLDLSTPVWPTQLPRYAHKTRRALSAADYSIPSSTRVPLDRHNVIGGWEVLVHPSGARYHYNKNMNTYTDYNVRDSLPHRLQNFEAWILAARNEIQGDAIIVAEPGKTAHVNGDIYLYYLVFPEGRTIAWLRPLHGSFLLQDCQYVRDLEHKCIELEGQFWKHVEFFPHGYKLHRSVLRELQAELNWIYGDALTLKLSVAAMIWNKDDMKEIINQLTNICDQLGPDDYIGESDVAFCGRIRHMLRHHQYLNYRGQPEARLLRTHSVDGKLTRWGLLSFISSAAMLCVPILVRERFKNIYVDGLVSLLDLNDFVDVFTGQNTWQMTLAGVILAVDAGFLAIQGVGTKTAASALVKGSVVFSVGCIFAGMSAQHFGHKMKSLRFAAYQLDTKMIVVIGIFSAPGFFGIMSVVLSSLGFLAGVFIDSQHSLPDTITSGCSVGIVVCLLVPLAVHGFTAELKLAEHDVAEV